MLSIKIQDCNKEECLNYAVWGFFPPFDETILTRPKYSSNQKEITLETGRF